MRRPLSRHAITEAARTILVEDGLHAVSLRKVAGVLGVTAPALYAHVEDKRDLLQGIAEQEFELMIERFRSIDAPDPVERIRQQCRAYVAYACENPALFKAMFLFRPELTAEPRGEDMPLATKAFEVAAEPVYDAVRDGRFKVSDPHLAALTIWTATHGVATMILSGPTLDGASPDEERLVDTVINTVINGLACGGDALDVTERPQPANTPA